jgi:hypothetical protein
LALVIAVGERADADAGAVDAARMRRVRFLQRDRLALHGPGELERMLDREHRLHADFPRHRSRRPERQVAFHDPSIELADRLQPEAFRFERRQRVGGRYAALQMDVHQHLVAAGGDVLFERVEQLRIARLVETDDRVHPAAERARLGGCRRGKSDE